MFRQRDLGKKKQFLWGNVLFWISISRSSLKSNFDIFLFLFFGELSLQFRLSLISFFFIIIDRFVDLKFYFISKWEAEISAIYLSRRRFFPQNPSRFKIKTFFFSPSCLFICFWLLLFALKLFQWNIFLTFFLSGILLLSSSSSSFVTVTASASFQLLVLLLLIIILIILIQ